MVSKIYNNQEIRLSKSSLSCLFITRKTKDFSHLIGANFNDSKRGQYTLTNYRGHEYSLGTELLNISYLIQQNGTCQQLQMALKKLK